MIDYTEMLSPKGPKAFYRRWYFWVGVIVILGVIYSAVWNWLVTPRVNPNPQKKIVVRGVFPYDKGFYLRVREDFYSSHPRCKIAARAFLIFKQAMVSREKFVPVQVSKEGGNRYSFTYYEDYFEPGFCEWSYGGVSAAVIVGETVEAFIGPNRKSRLITGQAATGMGVPFGLHHKFNVINYDCHFYEHEFMRIQGLVVERGFSCFDHLGKNNRRDQAVLDNELNFNFKKEIEYKKLGPDGRSIYFWKEGESK